jgi:excisionase family DNA binding protein
LGTITLEEAAKRLRISREEAEEWLRTGALAGEQVGGHWQVEEDSLESARQVRETQEELVEEGYLDPAEIAETTQEAREEAEEEGDEAVAGQGDDDRDEVLDPRELDRD